MSLRFGLFFSRPMRKDTHAGVLHSSTLPLHTVVFCLDNAVLRIEIFLSKMLHMYCTYVKFLPAAPKFTLERTELWNSLQFKIAICAWLLKVKRDLFPQNRLQVLIIFKQIEKSKFRFYHVYMTFKSKTRFLSLKSTSSFHYFWKNIEN